MNNKFAFTLAEVLITLSILGIVAAISIPSIINNYQKQATVSRLKMAYSMLDRLTQQSYIENGYPQAGSITNEIFDKYYRPYLNITKDCGYRSHSKYEKEKGCLKNDKMYTLSNVDNSSGGGYGYDTYYSVVLKNGMSLGVWNRPTTLPDHPIAFLVDIDGPNRGDSKKGQDIFMFAYHSANAVQSNCTYTGLMNGYFVPRLHAQKGCIVSRQHFLDNCKEGTSGEGCSGLIIKDGWKISSDYPWAYAHKK